MCFSGIVCGWETDQKVLLNTLRSEALEMENITEVK